MPEVKGCLIITGVVRAVFTSKKKIMLARLDGDWHEYRRLKREHADRMRQDGYQKKRRPQW